MQQVRDGIVTYAGTLAVAGLALAARWATYEDDFSLVGRFGTSDVYALQAPNSPFASRSGP